MKLDRVPKAPEWLKRDPKSGKYWVDIYRANAKPQRLTRSTKISDSKERAKYAGEQMIAKWLGQKLDGTAVRTLLKEVCDQALNIEKANAPGTFYNAKIYIGKIKDEFGHLYVDQINEGLWRNFEAKFRAENPGKHFFNLHKHMNVVMNHAYRLGLLKRPWQPTMQKDIAKPARVLTPQEKEKLLAVASPELRDQLLFAMTMGMRLREHLLLSWEQVDLKSRTLRLEATHTKTKKGRAIKLSPQVYGMLVRRKQKSKSRFVFPSKNPEKPSYSNKKAWATAKKNAGIKKRCRYHDLRHTWLTEAAKLVKEGRMSSALVCAYAGLSIRVFERNYLHLSSDDTANIAALIAV